MENEYLYKTADLYLASFLYSQGIKIRKIESKGNKKLFVFTKDNKTLKTAFDYYSNEAKIPPQKYKEAISTLKNIIFSSNSAESEDIANDY